MSVTDNRITETQLNDLLCLAGQMQQKAEAVDDRDTAVMAYAVQTACTELSELRSEHAAAMSTITAIIGLLGTSDEISISGQVSALLAQRDALAAENVTIKTMNDCLAEELRGYESDGAFEGPDMHKLWYSHSGALPATDAFLAELRTNAITEYADKRGFSFQHGSIHAHLGNGDVMVCSVTFENGNAGICFAPVREKEGGLGTNYEWTRGKTAEQVESVFVIESSNAEGLEVIQGKLAEAIVQIRQGAAL